METVDTLALSLYNPWAYLAAIGEKEWETRGWYTYYRGPIAIHSTVIFPHPARALCLQQPFKRVLMKAGIESVADLYVLRGVLLAVGTLVDCVPVNQVKSSLSSQEYAFGDYSPGRYAFKLADMVLLPKPIPAIGHRKLWKCTNVLYPRTGVSV